MNDSDMIRVFASGGLVSWALLLFWLVGLFVCVMQFARLRRMNLIPIIVGITAVIILLGCFHYANGQVIAGESLAGATGEEKDVLLSKGIGINMSALVISLFFALVLTLLGTIAATLRANLRGDDHTQEELQ